MSLPPAHVTGFGALCALGPDVPTLDQALRCGRTAFRPLALTGDPRPRRIAAPASLPPPDALHRRLAALAPHRAVAAGRLLRAAPPVSRAAAWVATEALAQAGLAGPRDEALSGRIALVLGGSSLQQGHLLTLQAARREASDPVPPRLGVTLLDSHALGLVGELFALHGPAQTVGAGFASGNLALQQGLLLLAAGEAEIVLCLGAWADLSMLELRALAATGAMATDTDPTTACRPFDRASTGFVFGQGAGAVVLERPDHAAARGAPVLGQLLAVAGVADGHAGASPNQAGETRAMLRALGQAGRAKEEINLISAHATGTPRGDAAEAEALADLFGDGRSRWLTAPKAMTGHTLYAAGLLEAIALWLQLRGGYLHPHPALADPLPALAAAGLRLPGQMPVRPDQPPRLALSNSFSFAGLNTAALLSGA